jgi:hypothetical protein
MDPEMIEYHGIEKFPIYECILFLVLIFITIFRRKLSSNDAYRSPEENQNNKILNVMETIVPVVPCNGDHPKHSIPQDGCINLDLICSDANILLNIVVYLSDTNIGKLALTSKNLRKDACSDFIWKQLWIETFGIMWNHKKVKEIRQIRGITWDPTDVSVKDSLSFGNEDLVIMQPTQGWLTFYLEFNFCWIDWLLAGCSSTELCLIGLHGSIYNITAFLSEHPVRNHVCIYLYI